jgi:hypothetical protein
MNKIVKVALIWILPFGFVLSVVYLYWSAKRKRLQLEHANFLNGDIELDTPFGKKKFNLSEIKNGVTLSEDDRYSLISYKSDVGSDTFTQKPISNYEFVLVYKRKPTIKIKKIDRLFEKITIKGITNTFDWSEEMLIK